MAGWDFSGGGGWGTPNSQVVQTYGAGSEYDNWLQDWNKRYIARQQEEAAANVRPDNMQQAMNDITVSASKRDPYVVGGAADAAYKMWNEGLAGNDGGYFTSEELNKFADLKDQEEKWKPTAFDFSALDNEKATKSADANAYAEGQNRNMDAYKQMTGGGYQGGILSQAYSAPFGNLGASVDGLGTSGANGLGQSTPNGIAGSGEPTGYGTFQGVAAPKNPYATEPQMNAGFRNPFDMWR